MPPSGLRVILGLVRLGQSKFQTLPQPLFFSFEGIDGSGKSTQIQLLADALTADGYDVVTVREPGGTALGEQIRSLLLDPDAQIDDRAESLLFSAARAQLVSDIVRPALERGGIVLADRFFDSTTAYQGFGRQIASIDWFGRFHSFVTDGLVPDRTYLLTLPSSEAYQRRADRASDRLESAGPAFYRRVSDGYESLAASYPTRFVRLDAKLSPTELSQMIYQDTQSYLGSLNKKNPVTPSE